MIHFNTSTRLIVFMCFCTLSSIAQPVVIYTNQFITPLTTPSIATWCQLDISPDSVNTLWEGTGIGTSSGEYINSNTVETILINGPGNVYDDPSGIGGDYAIGMLNLIHGDRMSLLIDTEGLPFVNVGMDLSAINTTCGGPFVMDTVAFLIEVLDAPGGEYDLIWDQAIDSDTLVGIGANADSFVFNWAHAEGSLDASSSTDGMVALRMRLIRSGYASFDNIYIEASEDSLIQSLPELEIRSLNSYPVPCTDQLNIQGLSPRSHMATIHSILGREVGRYSVSAEGRVDVSQLPSGMYIARVMEDGIMNTVRFLKE